jgi:hypothetical protein
MLSPSSLSPLMPSSAGWHGTRGGMGGNASGQQTAAATGEPAAAAASCGLGGGTARAAQVGGRRRPRTVVFLRVEGAAVVVGGALPAQHVDVAAQQRLLLRHQTLDGLLDCGGATRGWGGG